MAIDVNNMVQFYTGTTLPADAAEHSNRVYFIKSGNVGSLYKGNVLIAETNDSATIQAIQSSISALDKELDDHVKLYEALVKVVQTNSSNITANTSAIAEAKKAGDDAQSTINEYKTSNDARVQAVEDAINGAEPFEPISDSEIDALFA